MLSASLAPARGRQQLCDSLRKRSTKREFAGSSRSILAFAASYAVATASASFAGPSAKNGCCFTAEPDEWQPDAIAGVSTGYTVVENSAPSSSGKFLLVPGSRSVGGSSWILRLPPPSRARRPNS